MTLILAGVYARQSLVTPLNALLVINRTTDDKRVFRY